MAGIFSLRNWVMKQLMKNDKSGIMKLPPKGKIDFGEMLLREQLFKKGINPGMIKNEKQLDNILDTPAVSKSERAKPKKSGKVIEVDFDKGRWNKAQGGRPGLSYLLAEDTNERMPLAGGGSGKPPINFYVDFSGSGGGKQENFLNVPGLNESGYNYGGTFGADTTFPFLGGDLSVGGEFGIGRNKSNVDYKGQPIDFLSNVGEKKLGDDWNVGFKWRKKFAGGSLVKGANWLIKSLRGSREQLKTMNMSPGQLKYYLDQIDDQIKHLEAGGPIPEEVIQTIRKDPKFKSVWQNQKSADPDLREMEEVLLEYGQKHAEGGRIGLAAGGMGRRAFLKLMAALGLTGAAAKYGLPTLFKKATPKVAKEVITTPAAAGKPAWFDPLVTRIINEGEDVTKQFAYKERMRVHTKPISETEEVTIYRDLDDGSVRVNYGQKLKIDDTKPYERGNISRASNDPDQVDLIVRKGEEIQPDLKTGKGGGKTKASFEASEAEPRAVGGPEDADIEFDGIREVENVDDLMQDVSVLEEFATGKKLTGKKAAKAKKKKEDFQKFTEDNQAQAEYLENKYGPYDDSAMDDLADDFASGGIARMLGE